MAYTTLIDLFNGYRTAQPGEDMPGTVEVANARLIAAAPDLLAAAELLVDGVLQRGAYVLKMDTPDVGRLVAAIRQATGE